MWNVDQAAIPVGVKVARGLEPPDEPGHFAQTRGRGLRFEDGVGEQRGGENDPVVVVLQLPSARRAMLAPALPIPGKPFDDLYRLRPDAFCGQCSSIDFHP